MPASPWCTGATLNSRSDGRMVRTLKDSIMGVSALDDVLSSSTTSSSAFSIVERGFCPQSIKVRETRVWLLLRLEVVGVCADGKVVDI